MVKIVWLLPQQDNVGFYSYYYLFVSDSLLSNPNKIIMMELVIPAAYGNPDNRVKSQFCSGNASGTPEYSK